MFLFCLLFFFFLFATITCNRNYLRGNLTIIPDFGGSALDFLGNFEKYNDKQQFCWKCIPEIHCVKHVRIRSISPYLRTRIIRNTDTFHAVITLAFIGIVPNQWLPWSQWSSCSSKCSIGTRSRNRQFANIFACCDCHRQTQTESCGTPNNGCEQECNEENGSCKCKTGYVLNLGKWVKLLSIWKFRSSYLQVFYRETALRNFIKKHAGTALFSCFYC